MPPSGRSAGGFRLYTEDDVERLRLARSLWPLELSLDEMHDLLTTRDRLRAGPSAADRSELLGRLGRLAGFSAVADERCGRLREQLASVEQIAEMLRTEAGEPRSG